MAERTDDHDLPDAPAAADRGPDLEDLQEPIVLPSADSDVVEHTVTPDGSLCESLVHDCLKAPTASP